MLRRKRFVIGGILIVVALGYLAYTGISHSMTYYYTVGEVLQKARSLGNETVRVSGQVVPGSVEQEAGGLRLRFTIADVQADGHMPVFYRGAVPDSFRAGGEVVVEGYLDSSGVFQARTIMPQCASRYVANG